MGFYMLKNKIKSILVRLCICIEILIIGSIEYSNHVIAVFAEFVNKYHSTYKKFLYECP